MREKEIIEKYVNLRDDLVTQEAFGERRLSRVERAFLEVFNALLDASEEPSPGLPPEVKFIVDRTLKQGTMEIRAGTRVLGQIVNIGIEEE